MMLGPIRTLLERRRALREAGAAKEADVDVDLQVAGSRATGGRDTDTADSATTTGTGRNETFVGRVAGDDLGDPRETGAERRARDRPPRPRMPESVESHRDVSAGRMRSRSVGRARPGVPEVVVVQGMTVANYLMPAVAELGAWTRAHLVELPGFAGSGVPTQRLDVPGYAQAVAEWLDAAALGSVVLVGHSSGTQVAARAAVLRPHCVKALVLASPTVAPTARPLLRLVLRWRQDREPPGLTESHRPEWRRAGLRGLLHLVLVSLRDRIEESVAQVQVPVLVLRGEQDRLSTHEWAAGLAEGARGGGRYREMPGAHSFVWAQPAAWSAPIRLLAGQDQDVPGQADR